MNDSLTDRLRTERDEALELADSGVEAAAELREFASLMGEAAAEIERLQADASMAREVG